MTAAKPDCTGQRFGYLTVLGKGGRSPSNRQLWILQCECGKVVEKSRNNFANKPNPSCGCQKRCKTIERNQRRSLPDITGKRFGRLVVLGKGIQKPDNRGSYIQLWRMQCDCGRVIEIHRHSVEKKGQISCGCARKLGLIDNKRRPTDISGKRFGSLVAIALTGQRDKYNQPTWRLQCDCGSTCQMSLKTLARKCKYNLWVNCGDRSKHPEIWLHYPPTPNPYPKEAGEILAKYLYLTELQEPNYLNVGKRQAAIQDNKKDRLIRAAWIIAYRRSQGEHITELHEKRIINKHLRYSSVHVFWQSKIESQGGLLYDKNNKKRTIGSTMTDATLHDYPELELEGINMLPSETRPTKRLRFKRC